MNVIEETNEELSNFTISSEDDLGVLLASKSNEGVVRTLRKISNKKCFSCGSIDAH